MREIASHVFMETSYPGVTLGALAWKHGLILLDSPFRAEDIRAWRAALLNLSGGVDRMLVNLDEHLDRTLGSRAMEFTLAGQEQLVSVFASRPPSVKALPNETGADWELAENLTSTRWLPPEITFSTTLSLHWDDHPLRFEHHPGPSLAACWGILEDEGVIFLGDAVVVNQPPFLAAADLSPWIESLQVLLSGKYKNFTLVGGRNGLIPMEQVHNQVRFLTRVQNGLENLAKKNANPEATHAMVSDLVRNMKYPAKYDAQYRQRLRWGLEQYYLNHHHKK